MASMNHTVNDTSYIITSGYLRQCDSLLKGKMIPSSLINIFYAFYNICQFKGNNIGAFTWFITDKQLVKKILTASNQQIFESEKFIMGGLKWMIDLYPNGDKVSNKGSIKIYLRLISMPSEFEKILVSWNVRCDKTLSSCTWITEFNAVTDNDGWTDKRSLLKEWQNFDDLSISVMIKINNITLKHVSIKDPAIKLPAEGNKDDVMVYEDIIDEDTLFLMQNCHSRKKFESDMFGQGGIIWRLSYCPQGFHGDWDHEWFSVFLQLCVWPPFVKKIRAKYIIICAETGANIEIEREFDVESQSYGRVGFMDTKDIMSLDRLSFTTKVEIVSIEYEAEQDKLLAKFSNTIYDPLRIQQLLSNV